MKYLSISFIYNFIIHEIYLIKNRLFNITHKNIIEINNKCLNICIIIYQKNDGGNNL